MAERLSDAWAVLRSVSLSDADAAMMREGRRGRFSGGLPDDVLAIAGFLRAPVPRRIPVAWIDAMRPGVLNRLETAEQLAATVRRLHVKESEGAPYYPSDTDVQTVEERVERLREVAAMLEACMDGDGHLEFVARAGATGTFFIPDDEEGGTG